MDCPNCGAYNATNSYRCRRCNQILDPADASGASEAESNEPDWGPASGAGDQWGEHFRDPQSSESGQPAELEDPWSRPEPDEPVQSERAGSSSTDYDTTYTDPLPASPSTGPSYGNMTGDVPSYLWPAIGATICCCAPLGIPAIVFASRVDAYLASGDRAAAEEASNKAKMWALAAAGVSILVWIAIFCTGALTSDGSI